MPPPDPVPVQQSSTSIVTTKSGRQVINRGSPPLKKQKTKLSQQPSQQQPSPKPKPKPTPSQQQPSPKPKPKPKPSQQQQTTSRKGRVINPKKIFSPSPG